MTQPFKPALLLGCVCLLVIGMATSVFAGKPQDENGVYLGNGFPSGPHDNLNFLAKKENFTCPPADYQWTITGPEIDPDPADGIAIGDVVVGPACLDGYTCDQGEQVYGNVVFMRRNADGSLNEGSVQVEFQSGQKGPKGATEITKLRVTDWCSTDVDGTPAVVQVPANPDGYALYAWIKGNPHGNDGNPTFEFTSAELTAVEDEYGNNLLLLGLVDQNGAYALEDGQLQRVDDSSGGGKGKKGNNAIELTDLFTFAGSICWLNQTSVDLYCGDGSCIERVDDSGTPYPLCCLSANIDNGEISLDPTCDLDHEGDGYAYCQDTAYLEEDLIVGDGDGDGICEAGETCLTSYACPETLTIEDPDDPAGDGDGVCEPEQGETCIDLPTVANETSVCEVVPLCKDFSEEPTWIFNIEAFVNVMFGATNNEAFNVGFRWYPLPLQ